MVYVNPSPEVEREYQILVKRYEAFRRELMVGQDGADHHSRRPSGAPTREYRLLPDVQLAVRYGAEGIGLLRSEFSFLTYEDFPDENQQLTFTTEFSTPSDKRPVTIRTLDIGADKYPPYMRVPREDNPFLGWRSIRISLELSGIFKVQLRAILRAAARHDVRILFPMISSLEELRRARELLVEAQAELYKEGSNTTRNLKSASWLKCRRRSGWRSG